MSVDPAGAAGLVLGIPALIVSCANVYELALHARRIGPDGALIVTKFGNEQAAFHVWLWQTGFLKQLEPDILKNPVIGQVVVRNLESIKCEFVSRQQGLLLRHCVEYHENTVNDADAKAILRSDIRGAKAPH